MQLNLSETKYREGEEEINGKQEINFMEEGQEMRLPVDDFRKCFL